MARFIYILIFIALFGGMRLTAQNPVFDSLTKTAAGKGVVTIHQPPSVARLIGSLPDNAKTEEENGNRYLLVSGYRIQLFSGNNQRLSKDEAFNRESQIQKLYPELPTYVKYNAPFWRLRVGDFTSYEEALSMKLMLSDAFPSFKHEISVFKEDVRIPLN